MNRRAIGIALVLAIGSAAGGVRAENIHLYSYDPADPTTRQAAGPLTFTFRKGLFHNTVLNLRSTEATATAYLRPADERALGHGGLARAGDIDPYARDLYLVDPAEDGAALIAAFCPGASRAWMAFGALRFDHDLTVQVIGASTADGAPKLCRTLRFAFRGEWTLPPGRRIDARELERGRYPGN
jgi:hypothetical protein